MLSNIFVPTGGMPAWLRAIADWNPVSAVAAATRQLFGNPTGPANGAWPLEHPVVTSLAWTALLLAIFVPSAPSATPAPNNGAPNNGAGPGRGISGRGIW